MPKLLSSALPIGEIKDYGGGSLPEGYLACFGVAVSRTTYADLFAVIGTTYGSGDGSTTFNLPNFARRVAMGSGGIGTGTIGNTTGNTGGQETHTLTVGEMPAHAHNYTDPGHHHTYPIGVGNTQSSIFADSFNTGQAPVSTSLTGITILNNGGGGAHNTIQPSLIVTKMIRY